MDTPKISVVIPTHNRPERVKNAIQSVLKQTLTDFEVIVVDDGLEKRAEYAVRSFNDDRIVYIRHKCNKGGGAARNTGIQHARADVISFLDDDDEYLPTKLEKQFAILQRHYNDIDFVFCAIALHFEESDVVNIQSFRYSGIRDWYEDLLAHRLRTLTSSLMIKKQTLLTVGGFNTDFKSCQEWDLMIRIARICRGYALNEVLVTMHFLKGEHIGGSLERRIRGRELLLKEHFNALSKRPHALFHHYFQLALFYRDNDQSKQAKEYFLKATKEKFSVRVLLHYISLFGNGVLLRLYRRLANR